MMLSVNFVDIVTVDNPGPTTLRIEYFIKLPQTTRQMTNGVGNAYTLTTFHRTADLHTLTSQEIQAEIFDYTLQEGPVGDCREVTGASSSLTFQSWLLDLPSSL